MMEDIFLIVAVLGFGYVGFFMAVAWDSAIGSLRRDEEGSEKSALFLAAMTAALVLGLAFIFIG